MPDEIVAQFQQLSDYVRSLEKLSARMIYTIRAGILNAGAVDEMTKEAIELGIYPCGENAGER